MAYLVGLLGLVEAGHFQHEQVEERVGHQRHRLGHRLEQREDGRRLFRVVQHVHRPRRTCEPGKK